MGDGPLRRSRPRFWRLQFSLTSVFVLMTLSAVGVWYWYQRPYPVEVMVISLDGPLCLVGEDRDAYDKQPKNFREVSYHRRVSGGRAVQHGPYRGYDLQN